MTIQAFEYHLTGFLVSQINPAYSPKLDLSIEGMRSQQFSEWIFVFLLVGIALFSGIIVALMFNVTRKQNLRTGERWLLGAIILGVIAAVVIGAMQMLAGYLF
jgi:uncharacterized membrane protein YgdD (TMEM256/DUF423 family)